MKIEYLNDFLTLSETKNFSVCADALYISQPTLTRHIQDMEKELDVTLFERGPRGMVLTEAGALFLPYAKEILACSQKYTEALERYRAAKNHVLVLGSVYAMPQYGISPIIGAWGETHSEIKLRVLENDSNELFTWLRQGTIDGAFAREDFPDENGDFSRIHITRDHLVCLVPPDHPLSNEHTVSMQQLRNEKILYYEKSSLMRNLFLGAGYTVPDSGIGVKGRNALLLVKQGLGIMLEFRKPIDDSELGGFSILDIEPRIESDINFLYRSHSLSESGRQFVRFLEQHLNQ